MSSCRAPEILPNLTGKFTFSCPELIAADNFGLTTYNLIINKSNIGTNIYLIIVNDVIVAGRFIIEEAVPGPQFAGSQSFSTGYTISNTDTEVTIRKGGGPTWILQLVNRQLSAVLQGAELPVMSTPQPPISTGCLLQGFVSATPNGEQICETNFQVTIACDQFVRVLNYVFYNTDVLPVLCGKGCTIAARARSLNIDPADIMTYSMLRLMLSLLLFGRFDVQFLRQKYYEKFLCKLKKSCFADFGFIFTSNRYYPRFAGYFLE